MIEKINGNLIELRFDANELKNNFFEYTLPDGYSVQDIVPLTLLNVNFPFNHAPFIANTHYHFPVVNGESPSRFKFLIIDTKKQAMIRFCIEKFGAKPSVHYFDTAFEPILVTGKDGEEYHMIPSDQFK